MIKFKLDEIWFFQKIKCILDLKLNAKTYTCITSTIFYNCISKRLNFYEKFYLTPLNFHFFFFCVSQPLGQPVNNYFSFFFFFLKKNTAENLNKAVTLQIF
jgi:hypothetical protein